MNLEMTSRFLSRCTRLLLILTLAFAFSAGDAQAGKYRKSSFRRASKSWSKPASPSKKVWGQRDGGGIFSKKKSSSGYTKPGGTKKNGHHLSEEKRPFQLQRVQQTQLKKKQPVFQHLGL